ncbi:MAG TPA: UDP-N-acetylmuramate:L-alanyl-gamma-D-glutamyl-meso-diaminopimelate ligase [Nitrospinota bacterium]|nr:UDP-N-acetylmuramate:L-alanyl-gamma-D-glutamyl-meso-diaminopimelate ligase [Nitrospinota bacterium]
MDKSALKKIHMIAVCGTGMSSLAGMLKKSGYVVTGSDQDVYPPMSTKLEELGIPVKIGYKPSNLDENPDLVIVGNAVSRKNPEIKALLKKKIPYLSFPQALADFFLKEKETIVIAGTHGKTTASSLMAWILEVAGEDPGFMIGGIPLNFGENYKLGMGRYFVVEGDEYDTAFFDKGPKFLHYLPKNVILTSIEFDHADIYQDLNHIKESFKKFVQIIPEDKVLLLGLDFPHSSEMKKYAGCKTETYGFHPMAEWRAVDMKLGKSGAEFSINNKKEKMGPFHWSLMGRHNIQNAIGVIAIAIRLGIPLQTIKKSLKAFKGVRRRQEIKIEKNGIIVIDDFAHHPTSVRETIGAVKAHYPDKRLWALFEPRTATSRRNIFQNDYVDAFKAADKVIIAGVFRPDQIEQELIFSPSQLVSKLNSNGHSAYFIEEVDEIVDFLRKSLSPGDIVLVMSNGGFGGIHEKLGSMLKSMGNK